MKQISNILIVLFFAGMFFSCNDWLDQQPYDKVAGDQLYSTELGAREALNGLYLGLLDRSLYGGELTAGLIEAMSMHYSIPASHKYESPVSYEFSSSASASYFLAIWKGLYKLIAECNVFLTQIELNQANYNSDNYKLYRGEAIALRTFLHFDLLRLFAPACTEENKTKKAIPYYDSEVDQPNAYKTVEEITAQLLKDIDEAIGLLAKDPIYQNEGLVSQGSSFWDFRNFRFNIYAAWALKARICLHTGDKTTTYAITSALLEGRNPEGGENNFMNVFPSVLEFSSAYREPVGFSEVILGIHDINRTELYKKYFSTELKVTSIAAAGLARNSELFGIQDIRKNGFGTVDDLGEVTPLTSILKYQNKSVEGTESIMPYRYQVIPLIKKGEIFLMAAESSNNDQDKQHWLEELRLTRGYDKENTTENLTALLQDEYEREFYAEGQYFYYLKRNAVTTLKTQDVSGGKIQTKTVTLGYYVFPVPSEENDNRTE